VPLLGGDTVAGPVQAHGLTALGRGTCRPVPSRSGARPGDRVWLSGAVGGAMIGFEALRDGAAADTAPFRRPWPLLAQGRALAPVVTAMMDVSDGLLLDGSRLAVASGVTLSLEARTVPLAEGVPEARRADALRWGDDYQLLFTLPAGEIPPVAAHCIGAVLAPGACPVLLDGAPPAGDLGYIHAG
jgi:thiamine-monophosphate kinase